MTPREFRDRRLTLGLSTEQLAERLGVDPQTIRRWQDGSQSVPGPVTMAMAFLPPAGLPAGHHVPFHKRPHLAT